MGGLPDATGVLCNPVTAKVTKPRFSGFPGYGKGLRAYLRGRDCLNINRDLAWPFVTDCQGCVSGELQPVYRTEWDHN